MSPLGRGNLTYRRLAIVSALATLLVGVAWGALLVVDAYKLIDPNWTYGLAWLLALGGCFCTPVTFVLTIVFTVLALREKRPPQDPSSAGSQ